MTVGCGLLGEGGFYRKEYLWIALGSGVDCSRVGKCFCMSACEISVFKVYGLQKMGKEIGFVDGEWCGKVGIGFYMCLCGWWRQVVVGIRARANSMIMAD